MDEEGANKSAQAYQVLGSFAAEDKIEVSESEWIRVLNYFADEEAFDEDFLPWPR